MKLWDVSGDGKVWKVQLNVRDLGGDLDFTRRARIGTLSNRVREATLGIAAVGALPLGFQVKLGLVRGKYLPAGLHAADLLLSAPLGRLLSGLSGLIRCSCQHSSDSQPA